jgi:hypothetical protein
VQPVDRDQFELIKRKHGGYASWALWAPATRGPKSNIDDLKIFDIATNPATLALLITSAVMVGLNISRSFVEPFRNFHDANPHANDFKVRHAFAATPFYGAYMTDIIKNVPMVKSMDLIKHLRTHPAVVQSSVGLFREELQDLRCRRPTILAFGLAAHALLAENLMPGEYSRLIRLTHYSHRVAKEKYREVVLAQIRSHATDASGDEGAA